MAAPTITVMIAALKYKKLSIKEQRLSISPYLVVQEVLKRDALGD